MGNLEETSPRREQEPKRGAGKCGQITHVLRHRTVRSYSNRTPQPSSLGKITRPRSMRTPVAVSLAEAARHPYDVIQQRKELGNGRNARSIRSCSPSSLKTNCRAQRSSAAPRHAATLDELDVDAMKEADATVHVGLDPATFVGITGIADWLKTLAIPSQSSGEAAVR